MGCCLYYLYPGVWRYLLTDNGSSSHAFILFIGVVWGLSAPDIHDEKYYICLMCGNFSVPALFFLFIKQASILFAKAE
ncbi:hypothetical protein BACCELL_04796 [Bacteroides cellulosilyticus DSM 14838]|uniref:Uncharacterized protein n=1 Tax=Bacteroides cellulosilyticus DSM 14838 TaxID=537012 RepID=E2NKF4_9BACE|nr:hypothetical protein BACCELL_04796 [Bacteroides cellulosilyticus DSM 14838]